MVQSIFPGSMKFKIKIFNLNIFPAHNICQPLNPVHTLSGYYGSYLTNYVLFAKE